MKTKLIGLLVIGAVLLGMIPAAGAQEGFPPTIFRFASDVTAVTVDELEAGTVQAELAWHVAHVTDEHWVILQYYKMNAWETLADRNAGLPPVGTFETTLEPPLNFGPPTFRLLVVDEAGIALDERALVIPFNTEALEGVAPVVVSFTSTAENVDPAELADGSARVPVAWEVTNRLPQTNLVFEQLLTSDTAQNVELPRGNLWIPSSGEGVVAPVAPPDGAQVQLLLRVMDVISAEVLVEALLTLPVGDAPAAEAPAAPAEADAPAPGEVAEAEAPAATEAPAPTEAGPPPPLVIGDLAVQEDCLEFPTDPLRGWVDGDPRISPEVNYSAQVFNPTGDAKLIITPGDGSPQAVVRAPDPGLPIGPRPRWSPDETRVVFTNISLSAPGGGTIYVVNADGTGLVELVSYLGYYDDVAWSSDGAQLYFTSGVAEGEGSSTRVTGYKVYAVSAAGGTPQPVADGCAVPR